MKKIFTVLSALAVALVMMQASAIDMSKVTFTGFKPGFLQKVQLLEANHDALAEQGETPIMTRSWTQGTTTYEATFWGLGTLAESVGLQGETGPLTHQDIPFFAVALVLHGYPKGETIEKSTTSVLAYCSWPTYATLYSSNFDDEEADFKMVDFATFVNGNNVKKFQWNAFKYVNGSWSVYNFLPGVKDTNTGEISTFPIWSPLFPDLTSTVNSTPGLTITNNGSNYSGFELQAYDEEENTMKFAFDFYFSNNQSLSGVYNGEGELIDMTIEERKFNFNEFHVFDAGSVQSSDLTDLYYFPFTESWGPLKKFYFYGIQNGQLVIDTTTGVAFDSSKLLPYNAENDYDHLNSMQGAWYCADGTESPVNNTWTLLEPDYRDLGDKYGDDYKGLYAPFINPSAGSMVPYGFTAGEDNLWSTDDGIWGYYKGIRCYPNEFSMALGTADGVSSTGTDMMTNTYTTKYTGKATYHYNPKNMNDVEELTIVGNYEFNGVQNIVAEEGNVAVKTINGAIVVVAENNANVAVYTLDGACVANAKAIAGEELTVEAGKGVYVVNVNHKAVKVIL